MKHIFRLFIIGIVISCGNQNEIKIRGEIKNYGRNYVYVNKLDVYQSVILDSAKVSKSGIFVFKFKSEEPAFYQLLFYNKKFVNLLLYPGDDITFISDTQKDIYDSQILGSEDSKKIINLNKRLSIAIQKIDSLGAVFNNSDEKTKREGILEDIEKIIKDHKRYSKAFILDNQNSLTCLVALYQQIDTEVFLFNSLQDLQFYKLVYDSLSVKYSKIKHVRVLKENYNRMMNVYMNQKYLNDADKFTGLPDIKLPDVNRNLVSLSSLKGEIVLLNFWASWNRESVQQMTQLKKAYNKFRKKKFEIYNVSFDNSYAQWKKISIFEEIDWINVCDTSYPYSPTVAYYNVNKLPMNYLLNTKQDEILGKNLSLKELEQKLNSILN